jgi:hypothetical protein
LYKDKKFDTFIDQPELDARPDRDFNEE